MKTNPYMIQDYPHLVKYFASRNPGHLLVFVAPLLIFFLYVTMVNFTTVLETLLAILAGMVYWTFLEYVIHRFLYHIPYPTKTLSYFWGSFHQYHHADMSDHRVLNAGFLMVYVVTPLVLLPFAFFTDRIGIFSSIGVGLVVAHYFYEWVHYTLHYKVFEKGYLGYIQKYHFHHHEYAANKNFGNTSHFWDVVFGTYDEKYKNYSMPTKTRETLISEKSSH